MATSASRKMTIAAATSDNGVRDLGRALDELQEREKVRLGRILHDFHSLASEEMEEGGSASGGGASATDDSVVAVRTGETEESSSVPSSESDSSAVAQRDYIDVPEDLTSISPRAAWDVIDRLQEGGRIRLSDATGLVTLARDRLRRDPTVVDLRRRDDIKTVTVVGDLHGHSHSLLDALGLLCELGLGRDTGHAAVFNGNFSNQGGDNLEVLLTLLLLKLAYPDHVYLNRGDREDSILARLYGFEDEIDNKYGRTGGVGRLWDAVGEIFSSLPLCVRTRTAAILHGGIPHEGFNLECLSRITSEERCRIGSVLVPGDDTTRRLVKNILWSRPGSDDGVRPDGSEGGAGQGVLYGPDVVRRFLLDNDLKYLVRSHNPVDGGCDNNDDGAVVTVFSAAQHPQGDGYNWGAIVRIEESPLVDEELESGSRSGSGSVGDRGSTAVEATTRVILTPICYPGPNVSEEDCVEADSRYYHRTFESLTKLIVENKHQLLSAFAKAAAATKSGGRQRGSGNAGDANVVGEGEGLSLSHTSTFVTREQWADVMSHELNLHRLDWRPLQPYLAPTLLGESTVGEVQPNDDRNAPSEELGERFRDTGLIDYRRFLDLHCSKHCSPEEGLERLDDRAKDVLYRNQAKLLAVFKFLDTDGNGLIDREEFRRGIDMLNRRFLGEDSIKFQDPDAVFDAIDGNDNGVIELDEFKDVFRAASEGAS